MVEEHENGAIIKRCSNGRGANWLATQSIFLQDWQLGDLALQFRKWARPVTMTPYEVEEQLKERLLRDV